MKVAVGVRYMRVARVGCRGVFLLLSCGRLEVKWILEFSYLLLHAFFVQTVYH